MAVMDKKKRTGAEREHEVAEVNKMERLELV